MKLNGGATWQTRALHTKGQENKRGRYSLCQKNHFIMFCKVYKGKIAAERKQIVTANDLCLNCLGRHKSSDCESKKSCSVCHAKHHSMLYDACIEKTATTSHHVQRPLNILVSILLVTACVMDCFGVEHAVRVLVDQGSESSLSESLV